MGLLRFVSHFVGQPTTVVRSSLFLLHCQPCPLFPCLQWFTPILRHFLKKFWDRLEPKEAGSWLYKFSITHCSVVIQHNIYLKATTDNVIHYMKDSGDVDIFKMIIIYSSRATAWSLNMILSILLCHQTTLCLWTIVTRDYILVGVLHESCVCVNLF